MSPSYENIFLLSTMLLLVCCNNTVIILYIFGVIYFIVETPFSSLNSIKLLFNPDISFGLYATSPNPTILFIPLFLSIKYLFSLKSVFIKSILFNLSIDLNTFLSFLLWHELLPNLTRIVTILIWIATELTRIVHQSHWNPLVSLICRLS